VEDEVPLLIPQQGAVAGEAAGWPVGLPGSASLAGYEQHFSVKFADVSPLANDIEFRN
jgi:hypothetical protein